MTNSMTIRNAVTCETIATITLSDSVTIGQIIDAVIYLFDNFYNGVDGIERIVDVTVNGTEFEYYEYYGYVYERYCKLGVDGESLVGVLSD